MLSTQKYSCILCNEWILNFHVALPETYCSTIKYITNRLDIPRTETLRFLNAGNVIDFEQYGNMQFYTGWAAQFSAPDIQTKNQISSWVIFIISVYVLHWNTHVLFPKRTVRNRGISLHAPAITVNGWHLPAYIACLGMILLSGCFSMVPVDLFVVGWLLLRGCNSIWGNSLKTSYWLLVTFAAI